MIRLVRSRPFSGLGLFVVAVVASLAFECPDSPSNPDSASLSFSPREVARGETTTGMLTRTRTRDARTFTLAATDPGAVTIPATVTLATGVNQATFDVVTAPGSTATRVSITATTDGLSATNELFLREPEDPVAPLSIVSASLDNDDIVGGEAVWGTATVSRAVRDGDRAYVQIVGTRYWSRQDVPIPVGASSVRFRLATQPVDEVVKTTVGVGYSAIARFVEVPIELLPLPRLTSVTPASANQSNTVDITIRGDHLALGGDTSVSISGTGVTISNVRDISETSVTATLTIDPLAPVGPRALRVTTSLGTSNSVTFTVEEG